MTDTTSQHPSPMASELLAQIGTDSLAYAAKFVEGLQLTDDDVASIINGTPSGELIDWLAENGYFPKADEETPAERLPVIEDDPQPPPAA